MTIDLLPTLAGLAGAKLPALPIDGKDIWPLLAGKEGAKSPHEAYFFYWNNELQAVRSGKWKLHLPHTYRTLGTAPPGKDGKPGKYEQARTPTALYDLDADMAEKTNVADKHPDIVARMRELAEGMRADLGDSLTKAEGKGRRAPGKVD